MYRLTEDAGNGLTRCLGCGSQIGDHDRDCPAHVAFMDPNRLAVMYINLRAELEKMKFERDALLPMFDTAQWKTYCDDCAFKDDDKEYCGFENCSEAAAKWAALGSAKRGEV